MVSNPIPNVADGSASQKLVDELFLNLWTIDTGDVDDSVIGNGKFRRLNFFPEVRRERQHSSIELTQTLPLPITLARPRHADFVKNPVKIDVEPGHDGVGADPRPPIFVFVEFLLKAFLDVDDVIRPLLGRIFADEAP